MQPFDPEAKSREDLMASRSRQFIALDARAAKGHLSTPPLTRQERELVAHFASVARNLERDQSAASAPAPDRPW